MIELFLRLFIYRYHYDGIKIPGCWCDKYHEQEIWLSENLPGRWKLLWCGERYASFGGVSVYCYCFKSKEDLMAFKLRFV